MLGVHYSAEEGGYAKFRIPVFCRGAHQPGKYTVMVEREQAQKDITVRPGETTTVRIEVSRERK